jgi:peptide/nickel transport system ATP-binding protein
MTSLNPVMSVGDQIAEVLEIHTALSERERRRRVLDIMQAVRLPDPERIVDAYPHQISGGQRQRIMIASALVLDPALLIADEPTTALDVTIQAQIMELLEGLQKRLGLAVLLITHDLGVVAEFCERVVVMYTGRVVEESPVNELFAAPAHPYTRGLLHSLPGVAAKAGAPETRVGRLPTIKGMVPSINALPPGCKFNPRCPDVMDICLGREPALMAVGDHHTARCYLHGDAFDPERS